VESSAFWSAFPAWTGVADALSSWTTLTSGVPGFFETNIRAFLGAHVPLGADYAGWKSLSISPSSTKAIRGSPLALPMCARA
jgi:NTE family protein